MGLDFNLAILAFPVNIIVLLMFLVLFTVKPGSFIGRFGTTKVSIILISLLTLQCIIMGLIPQNSIKSSWPFVLTYLLLLINLALVIGRRLRGVSLKDFGFMLNHAGLFILLFAAGLGSADKEKYFMKVDEGKIEWRGASINSGGFVDLPVAILLKDFNMETYPSADSNSFEQPKSFSSQIEVYTKREKVKGGKIEVNHPLKVGSWQIYQYSYDVQAGKESSYSVFELVYDPWIVPVYTGIIMLFIGAITLFWKGGKR